MIIISLLWTLAMNSLTVIAVPFQIIYEAACNAERWQWYSDCYIAQIRCTLNQGVNNDFYAIHCGSEFATAPFECIMQTLCQMLWAASRWLASEIDCLTSPHCFGFSQRCVARPLCVRTQQKKRVHGRGFLWIIIVGSCCGHAEAEKTHLFGETFRAQKSMHFGYNIAFVWMIAYQMRIVYAIHKM